MEDPSVASVTTPIFQTSTFLFSQGSLDAFSDGNARDFPIYTRYGNPNQWSVQEKIATLEGAESSVVFSSGMAAITTVLLALTNRGGHIVSSRDVYGGTYNLLREDMHQFGRSVTFTDGSSMAAIRASVRDETQVLFFETLTNPLLKALPLTELIEFAHARKILVILDNTFLTPVLLKPIECGADVVIHSATKYLNGHSDVVAGVAAGSRKYMDRVWAQHLKIGGQLDPFVCFLLERGLKTLALRMRACSESTRKVVQFLSRHSKVLTVHHPLVEEGSPIHEHCNAGYGGMVSFRVEGGDEAALRVLGALSIPSVATSLGGVESLVSLPFNTSHSALTQAQRQQIGILPGLIRLSIGVEDCEDLLGDLEQALAKI